MSESESSAVQVKSKHENSVRKRVRPRKKLLYEKILKQMEFYFGDANLNKDRYLGNLMKQDPFVSLDVFLKFNKIRAITQEVTDIAKAIKNSSFLELSEDKQKVCRKTPVQPYDADTRTVYVESIPVTGSCEWLERVFRDYGPVAYISLPKFRNSQRIKGYGFIEFEKPEDAQRCLATFTKMGCKLPTSMPPEELSSIKTFTLDEPVDDVNDGREENEPPKKKSRKSKDRKLQKNLEIKLGNENEQEKKLETPKDENKSLASAIEETVTTDAESKDEITSQDEEKNNGETPRKKKTRKKTAKDRSTAKKKLNSNEAPNGALWGLQILSKTEWKALRNKYLNLQRKYMKDMKSRIRNQNYYSTIPTPGETSEEIETAIKPEKTEKSKSITPMERLPGVFVKETLSEPCLNVRLTKRTIRSNNHALHVEAKEGQSEVFIRFDSAEAATEYCNNCMNPSRVLSGAEEAAQWTQAEEARARGAGRPRRPLPAPPALAALIPASPQPTHTHIRFDEE